MSKQKARAAARKAVHERWCGRNPDHAPNGCGGEMDEAEFDAMFEAIMSVYFPAERASAGDGS